MHVRVCVCVGVCESREQSDQINLTPTLPPSVATKHRAQKKKIKSTGARDKETNGKPKKKEDELFFFLLISTARQNAAQHTNGTGTGNPWCRI